MEGICHLLLSLQEYKANKESTLGPTYSGQVAHWASSRNTESLKAYPALFSKMASWWSLNFLMLLLSY